MPGPSHGDGRAFPVQWSGRQVVAVLPGQIDVTNVDPVREGLLTVITGGAAVLLVDMTATISCDHAGADALVRVYQGAVANGTELRLVVMAPVVRRVIERSGLDRLVAVFPTLEAAKAAQARATVLPLPPRAAIAGAATLDGSRAVSHLPASSPASFEQDARQRARGQELQEALTGLTRGIFDAGLTLQTALDRPAAALRQAVKHALDLLDGTVCDARAVAFAWNDHNAYGQADGKEPGTSGRPRAQAAARPLVAGEEAPCPPGLLARKARETRASSRKVRERTLQVAALSAATEDLVATSLSQIAANHPHYADHLRALSQAAIGHATRIRQWAQEHSAAG